MQALNPDFVVDDNFIIAGPLNLNKRMMRADTIMGERLQLSPLQFRSLLMLVSNEGVSIPFEELHMFMTMPDEEKCSIQVAKDVIFTLANIVNVSGRGFAKIDVLPNDEYVFVTKWGMDWRTEPEEADSKCKPDEAAIVGTDKFSKIALSVAMMATLLVFIGSYFAYQVNDNGLIYIPNAPIPLAEMPIFQESVTFPYINGNTFHTTANNDIYVDTFNMSGDNFVFVLCIKLDETNTPLTHSILVPHGEATNQVELPETLQPGRYMARLILRAYCRRNLTEVESRSKQIVIYVEVINWTKDQNPRTTN